MPASDDKSDQGKPTTQAEKPAAKEGYEGPVQKPKKGTADFKGKSTLEILLDKLNRAIEELRKGRT